MKNIIIYTLDKKTLRHLSTSKTIFLFRYKNLIRCSINYANEKASKSRC